MSAEHLQQQLKKEFQEEQHKAAAKGHQPSLGKVIFRIYGARMAWAGIIKLAGDFAGLIGPLCVSGIVLYTANIYYKQDPGEKLGPHFIDVSEFIANGFVLMGITFIAVSFQSIAAQISLFYAIFYGMCLRSSIQTMVYEKSLSLSTFASIGEEMTTGQITNHMSTDAMNLLYMFQNFHFVWTVPFVVALVLYLLYEDLGVAALLGAVVYLIVIPLQLGIANFMAKHQKRALYFADKRLRYSNEILQGIKLLKSYGWEHPYLRVVENIRNQELISLLKMNVSYGLIGFIVSSSPLVVTLLTFGTYTTFTGELLTPEKAFSALALFNQLSAPLFILPLVTATLVNGIISTRRLQKFFIAQEIERSWNGRDWRDRVEGQGPSDYNEQGTTMDMIDDDVTCDDETTLMLPKMEISKNKRSDVYQATKNTKALINCLPESVAIKITNGNFTWEKASSIPVISDINVDIPAGKLTMVIGSVGSGKSSLVSAIQGEMTTLSGTVQFNEGTTSIAYAAQKAWLINSTFQGNVLFGKELDTKKYKKTIDVCALKPDIEILPGGDQTEIGEKGINMSGGQKQRISIARTVYSDKEIIILDDPLSALDVHVGSQVFHKAIVGTLLKKKRTVVLVTHQLQYLHHAHKIIVMKDGEVAHQGTLQDIIDEAPELYSEYQQAIKTVTESETEAEDIMSRMSDEEKREVFKRKTNQESSVESSRSKAGTKLIEEEEMEQGSVSYKVYAFYFRAMTWTMSIGFLAGCVGNAGFTVGTNFWLSEWSTAGITTDNSTIKPLSYYIAGYAGLSAGGVVTTFIGSMFIVSGAYIASRDLHISMFRNIAKCPMRFFDTTPLGRVLNRLAADTNILDMKLFQSMNVAVYSSVNYIGGLVVNSIILPVFLIFVVPMMVSYYFLAKFYVTTSRSLQRLDSVTKSPVFAHFSETLGGLPTIRAYGDQDRFYSTLIKKVNANNTAFLYLQTSNRWAVMRLELIGATGILIAGVGTIISSLNGTIEPSEVGLAVSYTLLVANYMKFAIRLAAETEMQMNAVERVQEYSGIANEDYQGTEPPESWPQRGEIKMNGIYVRYAKELDPVIKNLTVTFKSGEKVGICGRTGSGKSSLTLALFRIIDTCRGSILIDDIDISTVPLTTLRQRLAIIPQDPVLFSGTVRHNLDPENNGTDDELWHSLEISQLKDTVSQMPKGLDSEVSEGGENFSVGQRQLFCLARAFLRRSKILIMDEATASIDMGTDKILQEVVATMFADCTVLTIAHRVATILDSDSILTLADGEIVEYDTPENLLADHNSIFASLVNSKQ
ncbi:ATP-binding cassette sub-family C member 9-like [Acanthaster planci]|uniref:ATP-binding cassette sub-family C member 9-like n=1 Tax=Acanthaster planci TaxID=133434 RepID=A0A8B7ZIF6_ACAPL|nr:ATP-binding cassette sub-family C member 9-like [Acanthaster planci]